jgi:hypothetical protein
MSGADPFVLGSRAYVRRLPQAVAAVELVESVWEPEGPGGELVLFEAGDFQVSGLEGGPRYMRRAEFLASFAPLREWLAERRSGAAAGRN